MRYLFLFLLWFCSTTLSWAGIKENILSMTGNRHVRFVWVHRTSISQANLIVYDTESNQTRTLRTGITYDYWDKWTKPYISHDGQWVVYGDNNSTYKIPFAGGGATFLLGSQFACLQYDAATGKSWAYYKNSGGGMYRFNVNNPSEKNLVTNLTGNNTTWEFTVSADGKRAGCFTPEWDDCGIIDLEKGTMWKTGTGCWPHIAPDNSYRIFNLLMPHYNVTMVDAGGYSRSVSFSPNGTNIYHPRWSSDVRFATVDTRRTQDGDPQGYGMNNEATWFNQNGIYFGKFRSDFNGFESWTPVSDWSGNCNAYAWIGSAAANPQLDLSPASLDFYAYSGSGDPAAQNVTAAASGGLDISGIQVSESAGWLAVSVSGSGTSRTLRNQVTLGSLAPGTYTTTVTVTADGKSEQYTVKMTVTDPSNIHIKMNAGPNAVSGWEPDDAYVTGGQDYSQSLTADLTKTSGPGPNDLYTTCRHMGPKFVFSSVPNGTYTVRLHYVEYGDDPDGLRKMIITIEGQTVETAFNIQDAAGAILTAIVKEYSVTVSDGNGLTIEYALGSGNDAFVSGIEIVAAATTGIADRRSPITDLKAIPEGVFLNMQGEMIRGKTPPGIYIVRDGDKLKKVMVVPQ